MGCSPIDERICTVIGNMLLTCKDDESCIDSPQFPYISVHARHNIRHSFSDCDQDTQQLLSPIPVDAQAT